LKNETIHSQIIVELYDFLSDYYRDSTIAGYVMDSFGIEEGELQKSQVTYEVFKRVLQYIHKMSGDRQICFNAGRFFVKNRLFRSISISGLRFSLRKTYYTIDKILYDFFPGLRFIIDIKGKFSFLLKVDTDILSAQPDYFFSEYLKGIISSIPNYWDMPSARSKIVSYPFSIEEILNDLDVPFRKQDSRYIIYDNEVAFEREFSDGNIGDDDTQTVQFIPDDLYIKDIFINRKTVLKSTSLSIQVKWVDIPYKKVLLFGSFFFLGLISFIVSILNSFLPLLLSLNLLIIYEISILIIYTLLRNRNLKRVYTNAESSLSRELYEQKGTTGDAMHKTFNRIESIENLMEISKRIIHEKDISILVDTIRKLSAKALNAERATVFIHDKDKRELISRPELSEEAKEMRIPEDRGIAGQIFKIRKIINVKDAYNNPHFNKAVDKKTGFQTKTIIGSPLLDLENNIVGVIQILNKQDGEFQKIDEQILETLSSYIATALKDTLTIRKLQQRGISSEILRGMSSITRHIHDEYNRFLQEVEEIRDPKIILLYNRMVSISEVLNKLQFLFDEEYQIRLSSTNVRKIIDTFTLYIVKNRVDKLIRFNSKVSVAKSIEFRIDDDLFKKAYSEILNNSIEAINDDGIIRVRVFYCVDVPNDIIHDLSLMDLIKKFNSYNEEISIRFIDFVKGKKPFLETDLNRIRESMKEFIAFEFFDTGKGIDDTIKDKVFDPFFSTKNSFGLGLAIARAAAVRMGGRLEEPKREKNGKSIRMLIPLKI